MKITYSMHLISIEALSSLFDRSNESGNNWMRALLNQTVMLDVVEDFPNIVLGWPVIS